ncbi:MAG: small multi-drug export protein [Eubacterium sp.]|nr:small multi-drug export protein [Eubacterium sp.]
MIKQYLITFFVSMLPIIELRGAIPIAAGLGLPMVTSYIIAVIGNMIPVPFIYFFARKILEWGAGRKYVGKVFTALLNKGEKAGTKLEGKTGFALFIALALFVGIPLPGTGAWTGTLAASILKIDFKKSVISVMAGVLMAGIIMGLISAGVFSAIGVR